MGLFRIFEGMPAPEGENDDFNPRSPRGGSDRFYPRWCMDNALSPLAQKTVINYLKQNGRQYNLEYTNKISIGDGRFARGFWGIQLLEK